MAMTPIRKLVTVFVTSVAVVAGVAATQVNKPSPTPTDGPKPAATTVVTKKAVQVYDHPAKYIVGHHQAGAAWTRPEQARVWFVDVKGWADVAYNVMITPSGVIWKGRGEQYQSAANYGVNRDAVAFCWLGDKDKEDVTDPQLLTAARYVKEARVRHPGAILIGHKDAARVAKNAEASTSCPGARTVKNRSLRAVWLIVCGYDLKTAKARALAGK